MNREQFIEDFKEEFIDADEITVDGNTSFREIGSWDSLTGMAVLVMIQDKYDPSFNEDAFKTCKTVDDIFNIISSK